MDQPGFLDLVTSVWNSKVKATTTSSKIAAKFKLLRRVLKRWGNTLSNLNNVIKACNEVLLVLDSLEENRQLFKQEANFRSILKNHIMLLLQRKKIFWKQRYTARWTKFGDESTDFFHAAVTE
jgi:hypothetical protein